MKSFHKIRDKPEKERKGGLVVNFEKHKGKENITVLDDDVHTLIVGATRSGKTRSLVIQSILVQALAGESMINSDPKGELFQLYSQIQLKQ